MWLACAAGSRAEDGGASDAARRAAVVVRVGAGPSSRAITVGEIEDGLAAMPPFQRTMFGATPDAVRRAFLVDVLVRGALLDLAAQAADVAIHPAVQYALDRARSSATLRAVRAAAAPASSAPMSEVQAYYDENRARYHAPERIQVWRILCATREDAVSVLGAALANPTPREFTELAREHSQDKATNLRGGNLGFLTPDGQSNEPGLQVDPAIVMAAEAVRDGDFVRTPIAEGAYFAVVWRRGTIAASDHPLQEVAAQIRDTLWKVHVKEDADALLARLRSARLRDLDDDVLRFEDIPPPAAAPPTPSR
jgi:hypothetical protein